MTSSLNTDRNRGQKIAKLLNQAFGSAGVFGRTEMPEDIQPKGIRKGSIQHQLFITLTVAIDYQRDADTLWKVSRKTFEDPQTAYLFDPESLHLNPPRKIMKDMQKYGLSKKPSKDAVIWRTVGVTIYKKWNGDPINFLESCGWDCPEILKRLKTDTHVYNRKPVADYPYLRGDKIGPLWLRMLRDNVGIGKLQRLDQVPIPVDIHVARASLATGVVKGKFEGKLSDLFESMREAWFLSVKGLKTDGRPMIALDVDEPLWHLSKYGCTYRDRETGGCPKKSLCVTADFCVQGKIKIDKYQVEMNT